MSNMSYCRFENTSAGLRECEEFMDDPDLSEDEKKARRRLIRTCIRIADDFRDEVEE